MAVTGKYSRTLLDFDSEKTVFEVSAPVLTAANFDAQATLRAALGTAIANITLGTLNQAVFGNVDFQTNTPPASEIAQRESRWLIRYVDDVTQTLYHVTLGTADLVDHMSASAKGFADLADADVAAFVTAFEAYVLSPVGNAVTIQDIMHVGSNN